MCYAHGHLHHNAFVHNVRMTSTTELLRALSARGLTQLEISKRTRIPQPRVSRWMAGAAPDSADDALRIKALHDALARRKDAPKVSALKKAA